MADQGSAIWVLGLPHVLPLHLSPSVILSMHTTHLPLTRVHTHEHMHIRAHMLTSVT